MKIKLLLIMYVAVMTIMCMGFPPSSHAQSYIDLSWTAPGDDDTVGTAHEYDIRYSTSLITESNWDNATQAVGEPAPQISGSAESFTLTGLQSSTIYWVGIKTADELYLWSELSNIWSGETLNRPPSTINDFTGIPR